MDVDYAMLVKVYGSPTGEDQRRYSPAECVGCKKERVTGYPDPQHVSTSFARLIALLVLGGWCLGYQPAAHPLIQLAILTRYSLLLAFVPFCLGLFGLFGFPFGGSILKNLFVRSRPRQLASVTGMSLLLAMSCLVTFETTRLNARKRFSDYGVTLAARSAHHSVADEPQSFQSQSRRPQGPRWARLSLKGTVERMQSVHEGRPGVPGYVNKF